MGLSSSAWNAFLKTLEEPPPHVKFIFATTEANKVPVTILSRCQRYDFKLIPTQMIAGRLEQVLAREAIVADASAVQTLAREAAGSMRDAMSLLDQVIAFSGEKVSGDDVTRVLGVADRQDPPRAGELAGRRRCCGLLGRRRAVGPPRVRLGARDPGRPAPLAQSRGREGMRRYQRCAGGRRTESARVTRFGRRGGAGCRCTRIPGRCRQSSAVLPRLFERLRRHRSKQSASNGPRDGARALGATSAALAARRTAGACR